MITLNGFDFGVGTNFELEIIDENSGDSTATTSKNSELFPITFTEVDLISREGGGSIIDSFSHRLIKFKAPEGQNDRSKNLGIKLTVAGQVSNVIPFNYGAPTISRLSMCFPGYSQSVYQNECTTDTTLSLTVDCDPFNKETDGCKLGTNGGYTIAVIGDNYGKPGSKTQKVFFNDKELIQDGGISASHILKSQ